MRNNSPYTLLVQPFSEAYDNYEKAFTSSYYYIPLSSRIKHFAAAIFLSIPIVNAIALLALRYFTQMPPPIVNPTPKSKEKSFRWVMNKKEKIDLVDAANNYNKTSEAHTLVDVWHDKGVKVAMKLVLKHEQVKEEIPT